MKKKIFISFCLFALFSVLQAQDVKISSEDLMKLKEAEKQTNILIKENELLKKKITEMESDNANLNNQIVTLDGQILTKNEEIIEMKSYKTKGVSLESENNTLKRKIENLNEQIKTKNEEITELKSYKVSGVTLEAENNTLKSKIDGLNGQIITKNEEITELKPYKAKVAILEAENNSLKNKITAFNEQITAKNEEISKLKSDLLNRNTDITNIKNALNKTLQKSINAYVNGNNYDVSKVEELITLCRDNSEYITNTNIAPIIKSLENFKTLCEAINKSRETLNSQYDSQIVLNALSSINSAALFTKSQIQKDDVNAYKSLLSNYCNTNKEAFLYYQKADGYKRDNPSKCAAILKEGKLTIHPYYTYIISEFNKKIGNSFYQCILSESSCQ